MNITIFTPTYNRSQTLSRLYNSLIVQTCKCFEWFIVDDGFVDDTRHVIERWIDEKKINIRYIYQQNGGKMRAHNRGVMECKTELFMCCDSDDYLSNEYVVEHVLRASKKIMFEKCVAGIIAYKKIINASVNCAMEMRFPIGLQYSTLTYLYSHGFSGDTSLIFKTFILKQFLFPEIEGERFIPEAYVYNQIELKYSMLLLPKMIMTCEYLPDGYSNSFFKIFIKNPIGRQLYSIQIMETKHGIEFYKAIYIYIIASLFNTKQSFFVSLRKSPKPFLTMLFVPLGILGYFKFKAKANK